MRPELCRGYFYEERDVRDVREIRSRHWPVSLPGSEARAVIRHDDEKRLG